MSFFKPHFVFAISLFFIGTQGIANENAKEVGDEVFNGTTLTFQYKGNFSNATISVIGPNGFSVSHFQKQGSPYLDLATQVTLVDGSYNYQITVATDKIINISNPEDNGRGSNAKTTMNVGASQSGHFRIKYGIIITDLTTSEGE